ncbi:protein mono-ADP-ribosyltransferase PARP14-like isoform 2-T2 [Polymixia lowei]
MEEYPYPVTVEGGWTPAQYKTLKNKLQLYFQSKKKSSGGECLVQVTEQDPGRATVYFKSDDVRERVLARDSHEVSLENESVKLHLSSTSLEKALSQSIPTKPADVSDPPESNDGAGPGSVADTNEAEDVQSLSVVLDNVPGDMPRDLLSMLVENISGLKENGYGLEVIWETRRAVVTFNSPCDVERFLAVSQDNVKLQRHGLSIRLLEAAQCVRVETLPHSVVREMLELYFERWAEPVNITMIPEEQAAIITFDDPQVVGSISKADHVISTNSVKLYPYYESLGSALYGTDRPTWKMPESFTESVHHAVWRFLLMKKQIKTINKEMGPYFCSVELERPEVMLSPLPGLMRKKGLTAKHVDEWKGNAQKAFRQLLAQYTAFECTANAPAWKVAEKAVRSIVKEDALLLLDASRGILTVAGLAEDVMRVRAPVESIVLKAIGQIERQRDGVSEPMDLSPAMFYILQQEGLDKAASDISPELHLSYQGDTKKLTISGLPAEVYKTKSWILEKNIRMSKRPMDMDPPLLDFLKSVDSMEMSQDLFTSQGIRAVYSVEGRGLLLMGSSEGFLADAERRVKEVLSLKTLVVEDEEVLRKPEWKELTQQLLDTYNSSKKRTVVIQLERKDRITVVGFFNPVKEVSCNLQRFIVDYSRVQEAIRLKSCAVVQFIQEKKSEDWTRVAEADKVVVYFDPKRPRVTISGARLHVQKAKASFQELASSLCTDDHTVDKPGAKKYFLSQGSVFLTALMKELSCVVVLRSEDEEMEEEQEELYEEGSGFRTSTYCKVQTTSGVLVSVSKADICSFSVEAVVNAANEDLNHIGGLALALLKAAGPQLQKLSNDYIAKNGRLRPGDAIVTDSCNLPCKYVVHAVGPRFSDSDKNTAVSRLKLAVKESLKQATKLSCSTIAVPAISSGVFGFPLELCVETIARAVREFCDNQSHVGTLTEVHLVDNSDTTVRALAVAVDREFSDLGPNMTLPAQGNSGGSRYSSGNRGRAQGAHGGHQSQSPRGRGRGRGGGGGRPGNQGHPLGHRGHLRYGGEEAGLLCTLATPEGLKIILRKGNIQDQFTDVIVNTVSENLNLSQGAVSKAILEAAGPGLQSAARMKAMLPHGDVIVTDGFNLKCQKVFHAVCPFWDNGAGRAEEELISVIRFCLREAEKLQMVSLCFPAIGTGNMKFPRALVSRLLLEEIRGYSRRGASQHLGEVAIVVHPSDSQTVDCFIREFRGEVQVHVQHGDRDLEQSPPAQSTPRSQESSASFGQVSSPSLGVYHMQMGQLTLEVSSGDITKETSDAIINSSNKDFNLKSGVSKAILDSAGLTVQLECSQIVSAPGYQQRMMILTSAGLLPSRVIIHVIGQNDPVKIRDTVYSVLKTCEDNKFSSVAFPALGTGQGGASPSAVADAMIDAVVDFIRKKHQRFVRSVKILIFQPAMVKEFHRSMRRREGDDVQEKSILAKIKDTVSSFFSLGASEERPGGEGLVLEREEFEPAIFQFCADNSQAVRQVKQRIVDLIVAEQAQNTIIDPYISKLSQTDMEELKALQRKLTVSIRLEKSQDQEPFIQLEGLTRDVYTADSSIRDLIRAVERTENQKQKAVLVSGLVEWQYQDQSNNGAPAAFDILTNYDLEEALEKRSTVKIKIHNETFIADVLLRKAFKQRGQKEVELVRKDLRDAALPAHWEDMKSTLIKTVPLVQGSQEYNTVEQECRRTGLTLTIISIERVQNKTLWQSYQLMKKRLDEQNKHRNNEKQLFHGTNSDSIDRINNQGFNRSYAGAHGAMYGNGSYFAVDPSYSAQGYAKADALRNKRMYLAKVLVGDFTQGRAGIVTPPSKGLTNAAELYDSVTDNTSNPSMFVIFSDMQAYPEYLITFR